MTYPCIVSSFDWMREYTQWVPSSGVRLINLDLHLYVPHALII